MKARPQKQYVNDSRRKPLAAYMRSHNDLDYPSLQRPSRVLAQLLAQAAVVSPEDRYAASCAERWGMALCVPDMAEVELFLAEIGGRHGLGQS